MAQNRGFTATITTRQTDHAGLASGKFTEIDSLAFYWMSFIVGLVIELHTPFCALHIRDVHHFRTFFPAIFPRAFWYIPTPIFNTDLIAKPPRS